VADLPAHVLPSRTWSFCVKVCRKNTGEPKIGFVSVQAEKKLKNGTYADDIANAQETNFHASD